MADKIKHCALGLLLVTAFFSATLSSLEAASKKKKLPNCLKSLVIFYAPPEKGSGDQPIPIGTGFAIAYEGKKYLATNFNIIPRAANPLAKTIDGKEIPYKGVLMSKDKRDIVLFEIDEDKLQDNPLTPLPLEENLSEGVELGSKVVSYGCRRGWETISSSKGKVEAIGPVNIELSSSLAFNMNGGPVISYDTGKVVGVVALIPTLDVKRRSRRNKPPCLATRIDSVSELTPFDQKEFDSDREMLKKQKARLASVKAKYEWYLSRLDALMKKVKNGYGTNNRPIQEFKNAYEYDVRNIKKIILSGKTGAEKFKLQYFKKQYQQDLEGIVAVLKDFLKLGDSVEKLKEENKKASQKGKFKKGLRDKKIFDEKL